MITVEVGRTIGAPIDRVWSVYTDWTGWTSWARLGRVRLSYAGADEKNGVGAVRSISNFGYEIDEEIVAFEPPRRVVYRVVGGAIPIRDHEGEVVLEPEGDRTRVTWRCRFESTLPLIGPVTRWVVERTFAHVLARLAKRMAR